MDHQYASLLMERMDNIDLTIHLLDERISHAGSECQIGEDSDETIETIRDTLVNIACSIHSFDAQSERIATALERIATVLEFQVRGDR